MLSPPQIERYSRQIILRDFGGRGQDRLLSAAVAVIGTGDMSRTACVYLAAAGIGRLTVVDTECRAGAELGGIQSKTAAPAERCGAQAIAVWVGSLNPECRIVSCVGSLTAESMDRIVADHDIAITADAPAAICTLTSARCVARHRTFVWGIAAAFTGEIASFRGHRPESPCYACLPGGASGPPAAGWPPTAVAIGTMLACEVINRIVDVGEAVDGCRWTYDALSMDCREERLYKDPCCAVCSEMRIVEKD